MAGPGSTPAPGHLPAAPPEQKSTSPQAIRAILSGISVPPGSQAIPSWPEQADPVASPAAADEGALHMASAEQALPEVVARAERAGLPFTLVLARPGPAAAPGHPVPLAHSAEVEDLAAALSVSLSATQELMRAGPGHLVVVVPGRSGAGQRDSLRLMRRAAADGAPLFTWAAARYPLDGRTAGGLMQVASSRLDGDAAVPVDFAGVPTTSASSTGRLRVATIWAGVAAAVVVATVAFAMHGSGPGSIPRHATGTSGDTTLPGFGSSSGSGPTGTGTGGSVSGSGGSQAGSGAASSGSGTPSSAQGSGSGGPSTGGAANGSASSGSGLPAVGSGVKGASNTGNGSTGLIPGTTTTTLPGGVGGLIGAVGGLISGTGITSTGSGTGIAGTGIGTTTGTTIATTTSTTTTMVPLSAPSPTPSTETCTGLVQSAGCTVNGLLGGGLLGEL
ncbi:MAG: hypothetical protein ACYDD6_02805 [Acidimicrobiales bacterium]